MKELDVLLLVAIAAMGVLLMILLRQITILKRQTEEIVQEVKAYVAYVMEDSAGQATEVPAQKELEIRQNNEDAQSRIIQAVLGEYFP